MSKAVILIGGGGHAKVIIDCIRAEGNEVVGVLDDGLEPGTKVLDVPVLGKTKDYGRFTNNFFLIAIGNNDVRRRISESMDVQWHTAVHPSAVISEHSRIGPGTVIMPGAVINACTQIGAHCIINTGAIIEHDNRIEDYVHISPGAALGGTVKVGQGSHVGIGAAVKNNIQICSNCILGAGAVIVKNITEPGTYVGTPARKIK